MGPLGLRIREDGLAFDEVTALVREAERHGFAALFVPEAGGREAFTQLAAFASATERLRLGPGIATIFTRTPSLLAQAATTLDQLSGGRAFLGLGTGHAPALTAGHGVQFERPLARMREYVRIIRAILRGDAAMPAATLAPVTRFVIETPPRANLPIYVAALGPRMCRLAGEIADGVLLNWATPSYVAGALANIRAGAERAGRDPTSIDVACYLRVAAGADADELRRGLAREIARYINMPFYRAMFDEAGFGAFTRAVAAAYPEDPDRAGALVPDRMLEELAVMSDGAAMRARVERYRAMGITLPVVAPLPCGPDTAGSWRASIRMFGA